ncbi:chemotaxis protein [Streptomyces sp. NPDC085529]|uniref:baeRF3 domain-containing protein n=1 Tax=Streptomyces sp. NPDC085529 TaxID=3365729 RepID=UPI0037D2ACD8
MDPVLSSEVLAKLRRPRPYPAVSLVMPTHRRGPDNAQDPVRLRNLLAEAERRLGDDPDVPRERRLDILDQLSRAAAEVDPTHAEDGLVVYAAQGEHQVWSLPRSVPERVVLSDTFLTRNLVAARAAAQPYWAVAVAADRVSLWSGDPQRATEAARAGFPLTRGLEPQDVEREERVGDVPSLFRDEDTRQFLREAHEKLRVLLAAEPRPLYVLGSAPALGAVQELGPLAPDTVTVEHGGLADGPAAAVHAAVEPSRAARAAAAVTALSAELDAARGRREFAGGIDEVWRAAKEGRARLVAVEEDYRTVVREEGDHLQPAEAGDAGARDDMVDEIVERALDTGAEVRFVPGGTLDGQGRIAAVLRY